MPVDLMQVEKDGRAFRVAYKKGILVSAAPIAHSSHSNASTHTSLPPSLSGYKYVVLQVFSISLVLNLGPGIVAAAFAQRLHVLQVFSSKATY